MVNSEMFVASREIVERYAGGHAATVLKERLEVKV